MTTYIALLRAVNVGGRVVKMDELRKLFSELGFANVRTYIQSGNVFFDTPVTDRAALTRKIEQYLSKSLGYDVPIFLRTIAELENIEKLDPFKDVAVTDNIRLCVVFISASLPKTTKLPMQVEKSGCEYTLVSATEGEAFVVMNQLNGRPGNASAFVEKTFNTKATTRFFGTTVKMLQAAKKD